MEDLELYLRDVEDADVQVFYRQQLDPEATAMAAFPARDHATHHAHWRKIRSEGSAILKTVVVDGEVAGNVVSWLNEGHREIGYWIGRDFWGRGIATGAVQRFISSIEERPLVAWVATHNAGSIRVLQKCGFTQASEQPAPEPGKTPYVVFELNS